MKNSTARLPKMYFFAFADMFGIQAFKAPSGSEFTVRDGVLFSKDETVLYFYPPSRTDNSYTVPENVIDIYDGAFFQCQNLEAVILPNGLLRVRRYSRQTRKSHHRKPRLYRLWCNGDRGQL